MTPEERSGFVVSMGVRDDWWALNAEDAYAPEREIVDAHVHFWLPRDVPDPAVPGRMLRTSRFMPADLERQRGGHRLAAIVYVECGSGYRTSGDPRCFPVGETQFASTLASQFRARGGATALAAVAVFADLRDPHLDRVIDAHVEAGSVSLPYGTLWNAFKKLADRYPRSEGDALLAGTARRLYRIDG